MRFQFQPTAPETNHRWQMMALLFALSLVTGCASTQVSDQHAYTGGHLPIPPHIWVYDFVATPDDLPPGSAIPGVVTSTLPLTSEEIAEGRKLGAEIAKQLAAEITAMGMPGQVASTATQPQATDIVLRGAILSVTKGDAAERMAVGFGKGASSLTAAVEAFEVTGNGLQRLGSGELDSSSGKSPGAAVGAAGLVITHNPVGLIVGGGMNVYDQESGKSTVEGRAKQISADIAQHLQAQFQKQGWISPPASTSY